MILGQVALGWFRAARVGFFGGLDFMPGWLRAWLTFGLVDFWLDWFRLGCLLGLVGFGPGYRWARAGFGPVWLWSWCHCMGLAAFESR